VIRKLVSDTIRLGLDLRSWRAGFKALRMPSLVIAGFSCALGVVLAYHDGRGDLVNAIAVVIAGLALQAGVNLVNDFFEFRKKRVDDKISRLGFSRDDRQFLEVLIFIVGAAFFGFTGLLGLFLAWRSGWPVLLFGLGWVDRRVLLHRRATELQAEGSCGHSGLLPHGRHHDSRRLLRDRRHALLDFRACVGSPQLPDLPHPAGQRAARFQS